MTHPSPAPDHPLHAHYDALWRESLAAIQASGVAADPHLADKASDGRRGLTVLGRPDAATRAAVHAFLEELATISPGVYHYRPDELHVTILSLFTSTTDWAPHLARLDDYRAAVAPSLAGARRFAVDFVGLTASPAAVMVQGFPLDSTLEQLRERLRQSLRSADLGAGLDQRYRLQTAHMTALRFLRQPEQLPALLARIGAARRLPFGRTVFERLELVHNDWYMSADEVRLLEAYPLV